MKIDKDIPIPKQKGGGGKWQKIAVKMEVDDSIFFPEVKKGYWGSSAHSLCSALRSLGMKATLRSVEGGIRVWRTK